MIHISGGQGLLTTHSDKWDQDAARLYHYSDLDGVAGILNSRSVFATSMFCLNDSTEFVRGIRLALPQVERKRDGQPETFGQAYYVNLLQCLTQVLNLRLVNDNSIDAFVASFSTDDDSLSQWRAYGGDAPYAIGFPKVGLEQAAAAQGFVLGECQYEDDEHVRIVKELVERLVPAPQPPAVERWEAVAERLVATIAAQVGFFKDKSFKEEREWRLVTLPDRQCREREPEFRTRSGFIAPFIRFDLPSDAAFWEQTVVVVGPMRYQSEATFGMSRFLNVCRQRGSLPAEPSVSPSLTPYRSL